MPKSIRSYVRRGSRMTAKQNAALAAAWKLYGVEPPEAPSLLNLDQIFNRANPKILEIGFGMGHSLSVQAEAMPESDFLGVEVHLPGLGALLAVLVEKSLSNVRVIEGDAVEILEQYLPDESFDKIQIFFPDPWPKQRHHKRRLIQAEFVDLLSTKLKRGGVLHLATDWEDYALQMMKVLSANARLKNKIAEGLYAIPVNRASTKFENRGLKLGHKIWDLLFVKAD